jgi:hypothetical protein
MVQEQLQEAVSQRGNLEQARSKPHVLDDYTVDRVRQFYNEEQKLVDIATEQVARWLREHPTSPQKQDLDNLAGQIEQWGRVVKVILALADELSKGTIDKVMAKSDLELGLEAVLRGRKSPLTPEQHAAAKRISDKYSSLARAGRDNAAVLVEMMDQMPDFHHLIETVDAFSMDELSVRYEGFYQYAKLLESLAAGIRSGEIKVPK